MEDKSILFFLILMIFVFLYRILISILFLAKKKYIIDEKYYISFFYCSLVGILVLFTNRLIVGFVLVALLPLVLFLYVAFFKNRKYWIINGYEITESCFVNEIAKHFKQYKDANDRIKHFRIYRKKEEKRTKIEFSNIDFETKEKILKIIKTICKEKTIKANKNELIKLIAYCFFLLIFGFLVLITLLT